MGPLAPAAVLVGAPSVTATENERQLKCHGVEGIIEAYENSLNIVQLHGPTHFAPVIKHAARQAEKYKSEPTVYSVLLIITDGIINDMEETKEAIIDASDLPLSIIIVGVGEQDFSQMDQLVGDNQKLIVTSKGGWKKAKRNYVQFVEVNPLEGVSREGLPREALKKIPSQVEKWKCLIDKNRFQLPVPLPVSYFASVLCTKYPLISLKFKKKTNQNESIFFQK